jgi:catechol 2,3-dioxygenase-like lactoylglutathione lyase family enzyme
VQSSRLLLRAANFERSFWFYTEALNLHVNREWGSDSTRRVVCFLGGIFLKLSGSSEAPRSEKVSLWLQVRDVNAAGRELEDPGVDMVEAPVDKPWGLREMQVQDPDEVSIVLVQGPKEHSLRHP